MTKRRALWLMLLVVFLHTFASVFWIVYDNRPPLGQDCIRHTLDAARHLSSTDSYRAGLIDLIDPVLGTYPPAHREVLSLLFAIFGVEKRVAFGLSALSFSLLLLVVYGLGRMIARDDPLAAVLATFLVGCFPAVFASSHFDNLAMMLTLSVAVSMLLLLKSEGLTNLGWSMAFGASIGLGLLVKWTFPTFLWLPMLLVLVGVNSHGSRLRRRIANGLVALGVAAVIASPWYISHIGEITSLHAFNRDIYSTIAPQSPFAPFNLFFYPLRFAYGLTSVLAAAVMVGLALLYVKRQFHTIAICLSWVVGSCGVFLFLIPKWSRFTIPAYPALALVCAVGLTSLRPSKGRFILIALVLVIGMTISAQSIFPRDVIASTFRASFFESRVTPLIPSRSDWQIPRIVRAIASDWDSKKKLCIVAVAPKLPALQAYYCNFESIMNQRERMLFNSLSNSSLFFNLIDANYIVRRSGSFPSMAPEAEMSPFIPSGKQVEGIDRFLLDPPDFFAKHYEPIARFSCDDGQTIFIAKRISRFSFKEKRKLLRVLAPIFREPEQQDIALRILYRMAGWYKSSRKAWERLESKGLNRSWLPTDIGPDLVDVLEVEDMVHNIDADVFAGRRVPGGWEIRIPSKQIGLVQLPPGRAAFSVVARANMSGQEPPKIEISLNDRPIFSCVIDSKAPKVYEFEAQRRSHKTDGLLSIVLLAPANCTHSGRSSVIIDKIIIREVGG